MRSTSLIKPEAKPVILEAERVEHEKREHTRQWLNYFSGEKSWTRDFTCSLSSADDSEITDPSNDRIIAR